jgi:hypothetical protein
LTFESLARAGEIGLVVLRSIGSTARASCRRQCLPSAPEARFVGRVVLPREGAGLVGTFDIHAFEHGA